MITNRINPLSNAILLSRNNLSRYFKKKKSYSHDYREQLTPLHGAHPINYDGIILRKRRGNVSLRNKGFNAIRKVVAGCGHARPRRLDQALSRLFATKRR